MGDVWRGTDEVLGRTVAVKILLPALLDEPGFAERFRGEARTMATINHPGVVDVYDYGSDQQIAFLVMEYVEGDALSRTLSRVGRLTPARTMALVAQAADALQAAHEKGIVHRDVKPGNLLVRPNGTLVLTDFGIARSAMRRPAHRRRLGARHRVVHLARAGLRRDRHAVVGRVRARHRGLPVPLRPSAVRGRQPDRDRDEARTGARPAAARRHPAGDPGDRGPLDGERPGRPLAHRGDPGRRRPPGRRDARRAGGQPGAAPGPTRRPAVTERRPGVVAAVVAGDGAPARTRTNTRTSRRPTRRPGRCRRPTGCRTLHTIRSLRVTWRLRAVRRQARLVPETTREGRPPSRRHRHGRTEDTVTRWRRSPRPAKATEAPTGNC